LRCSRSCSTAAEPASFLILISSTFSEKNLVTVEAERERILGVEGVTSITVSLSISGLVMCALFYFGKIGSKVRI
jgi:hypothetical protein